MVDLATKTPVMFRSLLNVHPLEGLADVANAFGVTFAAVGHLPFRLALADYHKVSRNSASDFFSLVPPGEICTLIHTGNSKDSESIREQIAYVIPNFECFQWRILSEAQFKREQLAQNDEFEIPALSLSLSSDPLVGWVDPLGGLEDIYRKSYRLIRHIALSRNATGERRARTILEALKYFQLILSAELDYDELISQPDTHVFREAGRAWNEDLESALLDHLDSFHSIMLSIVSSAVSAKAFHVVYEVFGINEFLTRTGFGSSGNAAIQFESFLNRANDVSENHWIRYKHRHFANLSSNLSRFDVYPKISFGTSASGTFKKLVSRINISPASIESSPIFLDATQRVIACCSADIPADSDFISDDYYINLITLIPSNVWGKLQDEDIAVLILCGRKNPWICSIPYAVASSPFEVNDKKNSEGSAFV